MLVTIKHKFGTETMPLAKFCKENSLKISAADLADGKEISVKTFLGETKVSKK